MLPPDRKPGPTCEIRGERAHYLTRVLRLDVGDSFPAMDSGACLYDCSILESSPGRVLLSVQKAAGRPEQPTGVGNPFCQPQEARVDSPLTASSGDYPEHTFVAGSASPDLSGPRIVLVQALPKAGKMDLIVRQATEAGVSLVLPVLSRHCVSRPEPGKDRASRRERWERVAREALQQSGSGIPTSVHDIVDLRELPALLDSLCTPAGERLCLLLHEAPLDSASLHGYLGSIPETIVLCIGPEGGFSPEERSFLLDGGFRVMHLRAAVLRTETAALYAVAAVQTIISERSAWKPA